MEKWITKYYTLILIVFVGILFLFRAVFSFALEHDEAEMVLLSQKLALGYNQQPPLYNWLIILTNKVFNTIFVSSLWFKNVLFFAIFFFIYKAALLHFKHKVYALFSSASLAILNHFSIESLGYTHTLLVIFAVAFLFWVVARLIIKPTIFNYLLLGIALAIGLLSKYNFALSALAIFFAVCIQKPLRKFLLNPKILFSILVCMLLVTPHLYWLHGHYDQTASETLNDLRNTDIQGKLQQITSGFLELVKQIVVILLPLLIFMPILIRKEVKNLFKQISSDFTKLIGNTIVISTALIIVVILTTGAGKMHTRWLLPIFIFIPLYLFGKIDSLPELPKPRIRNFIVFQYVGFGLVALFFMVRIIFASDIGYKDRINRPYKPFADFLKNEWKIDQKNLDLIVSHRREVGGNMKIYLKDFPIETLDYNCNYLFNLNLVKNPKNILLIFYPENKEYVLNCYINNAYELREYGNFKHLQHYSTEEEFEFAYALLSKN